MIETIPFHFLRPWWLLAVLPCLALTLLLWRARSSGANWRRAIAPELLEYLLDAQTEQRQRWTWWLVFAGWLITCVALAGPTWEKLPQPVLQNREAVVIVLDLSLSMVVEDVQPSRLQRARYKIIDLLAKRNEGLTGLVVYSGDAHVVTPLTDDTATISNLVPALAPDMMPVYGSDVVSGIEQAQQLLQSSGVVHGRIVLITDGIETDDISAIAKQLSSTRHDFSILGVGTETGAPIPASGFGTSGFIKQSDGSIAIPQLHRERLQQLAQKTDGIYRDLSVDDSDLNALLPSTNPDDSALRLTERQFDQWRERGPWLILLLLPIAALAFRRGWLLIVFAAVLMTPTTPSHAADAPNSANQSAPQNSWRDQGQKIWRDLWTTPDQQAAQDLAHGDAKAAAEKFSDPAWRASALYRAGDYEKAAQSFQTLRDDNEKGKGNTSADADYNRGNALAHAGQLQDAIAAYDGALKKNPQMDDAKANSKVVEQLLKQQQQSQPDKKPSDKKDDSSTSEKSESDKTETDPSKSDQAQPEQQSSNKNQTDKSEGEKKTSDKQNKTEQNNQKAEQSSANKNKSQHDPSDAQKTKDTKPDTIEKKSDDASKQQQVAGDPKSEELTPEQQRQQQVMEQWLRQIPDDPAGLLRRKFDYEHRQKMGQQNPNTNRPVW